MNEFLGWYALIIPVLILLVVVPVSYGCVRLYEYLTKDSQVDILEGPYKRKED
jgi:hypothetical protein